jgi:L-threonylcarbamoyladenylate synthase
MPGSSGSGNAVDTTRVVEAAEVLAGGGVVVYPTETLYAIGVDALNDVALRRLAALKGRDPGKPIAVLVSDEVMLRRLVTTIPPHAAALMRRFWPGPLTIVLRARPALSPVLTGGGDGVGVRLSSHPTATALVRALGRPIAAPSANPAGRRPPTRIEEAEAYFSTLVDYYLAGGVLRGEPASTVADLRGDLQVIREGAIGAGVLRASLAARP